MNTVEHPCASKDCMPVGLAKWYNFFRMMVAALLAALLLGLMARGCQFDAIGAPGLVAPAASVLPGAMTLTGDGTPGSLVDVSLNGESLGRVRVGADGKWSLATDNLPEGNYEAIATAYDPDGGFRGRSSAVAWTVAAAAAAVAAAPAAPTYDVPTIALPADINSADIALSGTGTPGTTVEILRNGSVIGTADVGDDGTWQFGAAADGANTTFEARGLDPDGGEIGVSNVVQLVAPGSAGPLTIAGPSAACSFSEADGTYTANIALAGTGTPGASVEIFANGNSVGTTTVGNDGNWQYESASEMMPSNTNVIARMTLADGTRLNTLAACSIAAPQITAATSQMVDDGADPEPVAVEIEDVADGVVEGEDVMVSGSAEPGATVEIFVNGASQGTVTADADGVWSFKGSFPAGEHVVEARDVTGGEVRSTSSTQPLVVVAAEVEEPEEEVAEASGDGSLAVSNVSAVDAPTIGTVNFGMSGTGKPGVQLAVFENGVQVGGALVQEDGTWSCTCVLPPGEHVLIVQDVNDSTYTSEEITFVVENLTQAPTPPVGNGVSFRCDGTPPNGEIRGTVYVVAQCEYGSLIADRLGTTVAELLAYNPQLESLSLIYPGQVLNIPSNAGCFDDNHSG